MGKKVKKKFKFKKFIIFLLILFLIYTLIDYAVNIKTKNIVILNNNYYTDDEIIYTSGINNYPKFLLLNKSKIKKNHLSEGNENSPVFLWQAENMKN